MARSAWRWTSSGDVFIAGIGNNQVVQVTAGVPVAVSPATPTVSVNPVSITYGTGLSSSQLIGTATWTVGGSPVTVAGTFTYTTAAGNVLRRSSAPAAEASFGPPCAQRQHALAYTTASTTVIVNVAQATQRRSSVNPVNITHRRHGTAFQHPGSSGTATGPSAGTTVTVTGTTLPTQPRRGNVLGARYRARAKRVTFHAQRQHKLHHCVHNGDRQRRPGQHDHRSLLFLDESDEVYGQAVTFHGHRRQLDVAIGRAAYRLGHVFRRRTTTLGSAPPRRSGVNFPCGPQLLPSAPNSITAVYSGDPNLHQRPLDGTQPDRPARMATTTAVASSANPLGLRPVGHLLGDGQPNGGGRVV